MNFKTFINELSGNETYRQPTEPTITHKGMEAEQEIKLIDIISRKSVEQWQFWDGAFFDDAEQKYLVNLLKSRRDALIRQQVIR